MVALRHTLVCQFNGGYAFRTIAGTGKRHQQQRVCGAQVVHRIRDQIGRRYGGNVFPGVAGEPGRNDVADKGRGACPRQHDPQLALAQQRRQEVIDRRAQVIDIVE